MRIIELSAENIKKLKCVDITPDAHVVQITGKNGSGKSSVLDAILYALAGTKHIDSRPIRDGEAKAHVTLDLGEFIVTRRFNAGGASGGSLTIESQDGRARYTSPQTLLDKLVGPLTFDPLHFANSEPKQQLELLRALVPLDVDLDALDLDNRRDFDARTELHRTIKQLEAQLASSDELDAIEPPSESPVQLLTELAGAVEYNRRVDIEARRRGDVSVAIAAKEIELRQLEHEIGELRREREQWPEAEAPIDVQALRLRVDAASTQQRLFDHAQLARQQREQLLMKRDHASTTAAEFTKSIERRIKERTSAVARAKMPVAGLNFGEDEVLFNGLPLAQASSAEQLRVSVAIAMAGSPRLRVLRIKDGSLLDSTSLALIAEMAETHDWQCWIESVDESGAVGICMEEGSVTSVDGIAVANG